MLKTLSKIIAHVESNNDQYAIRFESNLYAKLVNTRLIKKITSINTCSKETAFMITATSWGKYQILGSNLYTFCNLNKPIGVYLCDTTLQDATFEEFLRYKKIDVNATLQNIAKLSEVKDEIFLSSKDYREATTRFKSFLDKNRDKYNALFSFISRYNGSRFLSDAFYAYLLRVLYFYKKTKGG